jgi:hypothetical protein
VNAATWGKEQEQWLRQDLAAIAPSARLPTGITRSSARVRITATIRICAIWSRFYSATRRMSPLQATIIFTNAFGRLNADGNADPRGMRHFVVGTGGAGLYEIGAIKLYSEVRDTTQPWCDQVYASAEPIRLGVRSHRRPDIYRSRQRAVPWHPQPFEVTNGSLDRWLETRYGIVRHAIGTSRNVEPGG